MWVKVKFSGSSREYSYKFDLNCTVKRGDYLVVNSPYGGYKIVKCIEVFKGKAPKVATKRILVKLNREALEV